jgi:hypothetical protein
MHTAQRLPGLVVLIFSVLAGLPGPAGAAVLSGTHQPGEGTLFSVEIPAAATNLSLRITNTAAGFSHLYLRAGTSASTNEHDFVARLSSGVCTLALERPELVPGTAYALWVQTPATSAAHAFSVGVEFDRPDARKSTLPVIKTLAMDVAGVLNPGETNYFQVDVPPNLAGWRLVVSGTGSADPDLLLQRGALPGTQVLMSSFGRRLDTLFLPGTDLVPGTYFVAVTVPKADSGNATYSLRSEIHPLVTLDWDPGLGPEPTEVYHNASTLGGDYFFKVTTTNTLAGLWRSRLTAVLGDADLYLKRGAFPTETAKDFASTRAGSDGVVLAEAGQFVAGQTWYLMVLGQPGAEWSLVTGNGYVPSLPAPGADGATGTNEVVAVEGVNFYRTTVPAGALAWRVGLDGRTNVVLVNRDRAAHPLSNPRPDWYLPSQLLLVPPYLKAGSEYFVSVAGQPGEAFVLGARPQPVTDLAMDASTTVVSLAERYVTYRVALPAEQVAWQVDVQATEGEAHLAVRDAFVGNEYVNTAYLELTNRAMQVVTLVPPTLHDGAYYVTVYGAPPFSATLSNRRPPVGYVPYRFEVTNPLPDAHGWRYYGVTNIEEQAASLGWDLSLRDQAAGTELALRRNRAPGSWQYRSNLVQATVVAPLMRTEAEVISTNGYLQRPQHPADIWYIGVRHPRIPAGPFVLTGGDIPVTPLDLGGTWRSETLLDRPPGYAQFFRVVVPPDALGLEARLAEVTRGLPRLVVGRDLLPLGPRSQFAGGAVWNAPNASTNWPSGAQIAFETDWTAFNTSAAGTNETGHYFHAGRGNPMAPGTYYLGVYPATGPTATNRAAARILVRGLFPDTSIRDLAFDGGEATTDELRAHETAWYRVEIPAETESWKFRVTLPTNQEAMLVLRRTGVPNYGAGVFSPTNLSGTRLRKGGHEHFLLLPSYPATNIPAGVYHLGLVSEGRGPAGGRAGSNSCVLTVTSEGSLTFPDLGILDPLGQTALGISTNQAGGEVRGVRFTVSEGTPAFEIRLKNRVGNPRMALRSDGLLPVLGDPYGNSGGATATWSDDDFIRIPSPLPGEYRLLVQAAGLGAAYPDASYLLEVVAQEAHPLAFDGGLYTVTNQVATGWEYFRVTVPEGALGWDLRITNVTRGDPRLVICRDSVPASLTTRTAAGGAWTPYLATNWPAGNQVAPDKDWTGYTQSALGTNEAGQVFMAAMGNPLVPGNYVIGVTSGGAPGPTNLLEYRILSRGIGSGFAIPVEPVLFDGGVGLAEGVPPREARYFKVEVPEATPSWRVRMEAQWGDSLMVVRRGGLPNFGATVSTVVTNLGGTLLQKSNHEHFVLLPSPPATGIPAGDYYFGVVSEGILPAGTRIGAATSGARLRSLGPVVPVDLGVLDGQALREIRDTRQLDGGELASYRFEVTPGTIAVVVRLDGRIGNPTMTLRAGGAIPRSSEVYGRQGGMPEDWRDPAYIRIPGSVGGEYQLIVQAGLVSGRYEPAGYTLRIYSLVMETIPLAFDGGTHRVEGHTSKEWVFFSVDVPPEALGWDLRLRESTGSDPAMVLCRADYPRTLSSTFSWATTTNWPVGGQALPGPDWTGYRLNADGSIADNTTFAAGMGAPLVPGRYIIGVTSADARDEADLAYTITSRGIGDGYRIPVPRWTVGETNATLAGLPVRDAAYFQVEVPEETPGWELALRALRGDALLAVKRGSLPSIAAGSQVLASALGGGHRVQKPGDEYLRLGTVTGEGFVPAGRYFLAVVGEGEAPVSPGGPSGTGTSDAVLESRLPSPPVDLGFVVPGGVERWHSNSLAGGESATYRFTLPSGSLGLEVTLAAESGWPRLRLRNDGLQPLEPTTYGQDGGFKGQWEGTRRIALVSPTSGVYQVTVQAGPTNTTYLPLDYRLEVRAESRVSVLSFDGGRASVTNQAPDLWKTYLVEVPPQAVGWELRIANVTSGNPRLVIRRGEVPVDLQSRDELYGLTNWANGAQLAPGADWTGRDEADGTSAVGRVFQVGMGNPLTPGLYYVGITNASVLAANYTLTSQGIGDGFSLPVVELPFDNGLDAPVLAPRGTAWYRVDVPTNAVSWKVRLGTDSGEALLVAQKGALPGIRALTTNTLQRTQGGRLMRKPGAEHLLALPVGGTNTLLPGGLYFLGVIGEGMVASNNLSRLGTNVSHVTLVSEGGPPPSPLGTVQDSELVAPVHLAGGESGAWRFQVADGTQAVEVWLPSAQGAPAMTLAPGTLAPGVTNRYGVDGGVPHAWQSGSVITLANPASTNYVATVQAGVRDGLFVDADVDLHVRALPIGDLNFDAALNANGRSHVATGTIEEGHRMFFRVDVPSELQGEPVVGWRLSLSSTHGRPVFRVRPGALPDDLSGTNTSRAVLRQAVIVPDFLRPGEWYVEVQAGGLTSYTLTSEALRLDRPVWAMPEPGEPVTTPGLPAGGLVFGDSGIGADGVAVPGLYQDLEQDSFHYYAVRVPDRNPGLLRTELLAYNGDPNLYLRRGLPPSVSGWTVYERALTNSVGSEYGNWVPLDRKTQTRLEPGLWYLAVHAAGGANVRYRLLASLADIAELPATPGAVSDPKVLVAGDWQHFRVVLPLDMPDGWEFTLQQIAGDVAWHLRDTVPPGHGTNGVHYVTWKDDAPNHGPYAPVFGTGTTRLRVPPLRPGTAYYLGVRALSDARFTVGSGPAGQPLPLTGTLSFRDGQVSDILPVGGVRRYRIDVPDDGRWFRLSGVNPSTVRYYLDQGTLPTLTAADHWASVGANAAIERVLYAGEWPWIPGQHYFLAITNLAATSQTFALLLEGRDCSNDDSDQDTLPDCWESTWFGSVFTYGPDSDPDRDGLCNHDEYLRGTNPTSAADPGLPEVVGRHVFYNESQFDGRNAAANAADDDAIAPDKAALLPGERATFANYTSYSRGLNGLMVDIRALRGDPTAADFVFRCGTDGDPATWPLAPAPAAVAVRRQAGVGGSDRVTLVWGADAVKKKWLQVTVLATAATGLPQPDAFCFGNAVGETGNSTGDARVTSADALRLLGNMTLTAAITNRYDVNRDGRVGSADRLMILGNVSSIEPLPLLDLVAGAALHEAPVGAPTAPKPTEFEAVGEGLRVRWVADGRPVLVWTRESAVDGEWELYDRVEAGASPGEVVELRLPMEPGAPARYYRFESVLDPAVRQ